MSGAGPTASVSIETANRGWWEQPIGMPSIVILLGLVATVLGIYATVRKLLRDSAKEAQQRASDAAAEAEKRTKQITDLISEGDVRLDDRVGALEQQGRSFMPKSEILGLIEHEKDNRRGSQLQLQGQVDRHTEQLATLNLQYGLISQRQDSIASDVAEIKATMKEQGRDFNGKLDRLLDDRRS